MIENKCGGNMENKCLFYENEEMANLIIFSLV
jgi:hypothetical protein